MQDYAASVQGVCIRASRLTASGSIATGSNASYVMSAFIRTSFTPEYDEGEEITERNAAGELCVSYKAPDTLRRVTLELAICEPDAELTELLAGGTLLGSAAGNSTTLSAATIVGATTVTTAVALTATGPYDLDTGANLERATVIAIAGTTATLAAPLTKAHATGVAIAAVTANQGYAAPSTGIDPNPNGCSLEVWSNAVQNSRRAAVNPFFHWVFPKVQVRPTGDRTIENGLLANVFSGTGEGNGAFGTGPAKSWPYISDRAYQYARVPVAPTGVRGYVAVV